VTFLADISGTPLHDLPVFLRAGGSVGFDLIFWLLFHQGKSDIKNKIIEDILLMTWSPSKAGKAW